MFILFVGQLDEMINATLGVNSAIDVVKGTIESFILNPDLLQDYVDNLILLAKAYAGLKVAVGIGNKIKKVMLDVNTAQLAATEAATADAAARLQAANVIASGEKVKQAATVQTIATINSELKAKQQAAAADLQQIKNSGQIAVVRANQAVQAKTLHAESIARSIQRIETEQLILRIEVQKQAAALRENMTFRARIIAGGRMAPAKRNPCCNRRKPVSRQSKPDYGNGRIDESGKRSHAGNHQT